MTTSGSINYNQNRNEIITDALSLLGVVSAGGTARTNDITFCSNQLNKMIKAWQSRGIHLWKECEAVVSLVNGQSIYNLSSTSTDKMGDNPIETTLSANATGSSLSVGSTTGMSALDIIGIELDNNTRQFTTIVSVDSSTTLTITAALTSIASSGRSVISYTTSSGRPLNITNARYKYNNGVERQIKKMGRAEFMSLPNKSNPGTVTAYYYSPQLNAGKLYVWLTPNSAGDVLKVSYIKSFEDFDNSTDDPDFPQEALDAITKNLAASVAPAYGIDLNKVSPGLLMDATRSLVQLEGWDSEEGSVNMVPNRRDDNDY